MLFAVYKTEPELGLAIKESGVDRSKLYVVTKVMGGIADPESALKTSLKKLQLEHVDLYALQADSHSGRAANGVPAT